MWGVVSRLAREHGISRQTIYEIAAAGWQVLTTGLAPGPHGPPGRAMIRVDRNRLARVSVVLTEVGVSQWDIPLCLTELLDTRVSPSWVNAELAKVEPVAARLNQQWCPAVNELLSGDEIYSNGWPNLLVVGNDSSRPLRPSVWNSTWRLGSGGALTRRTKVI